VSAADNFVSFQPAAGATALTLGADVPLVIAADTADRSGVAIALQSFLGDVTDVTGRTPQLSQVGSGKAALPAGTRLVVGTIAGNAYLRQLVRKKIIDGRQLEGKTEKYLLTTVKGAPGADGDVVVIAGSDMRGAIYGIYELSRQMGISPWHWWADVPAVHHDSLYILPGTFTDGEPTVRYRGIFLNDEAPCLSGWVREAFPDSSCPSARSTARGFNHLFYARVFELLLARHVGQCLLCRRPAEQHHGCRHGHHARHVAPRAHGAQPPGVGASTIPPRAVGLCRQSGGD
jgi:hypothetical protein